MIEDIKSVISFLNNIANNPGIMALKSEIDSLKSFIFTNQEEKFQLQKINGELLETVNKLKSQIADYDHWNKDKENYEIVKISDSTFAYQLKGTSQIFCPKCFNDDRVPIHIRPPQTTFSRMQQCPKCKSSYVNDKE